MDAEHAAIDVHELLERCLHEAAFAVRMLDSFVEGVTHLKGGLSEAIARGELASAAKIAHSLKGSAANIGATHLRELLIDFEQALRDEATSKVEAMSGEVFSQIELALQTARTLKTQPAGIAA